MLSVCPFPGLVYFHLMHVQETDLMDIENRLVVAKGEGVGRGVEWEFGVSRCKLLHVEWINNKVLL